MIETGEVREVMRWAVGLALVVLIGVWLWEDVRIKRNRRR